MRLRAWFSSPAYRDWLATPLAELASLAVGLDDIAPAAMPPAATTPLPAATVPSTASPTALVVTDTAVPTTAPVTVTTVQAESSSATPGSP
ncbi:hypothetical protein [Jeongeupia sp. USM3]|uniref:hypothetical protein n=1 Tax=Jeongeupia sp. USM3 TaxID=1906741 RepID=UPI00196AFDFA|nr:hypothetical protein [Jeongeupia sp. USM3]